MYKQIILTISIIAITSVAQADCYEGDSLTICRDDNGIKHYFSKIGESIWPRAYTTHGNSNYRAGKATNQNTWNQTIQHSGYGHSMVDVEGLWESDR